ncbi:hypothetical protein Tco_0836975 [Tanacetum coccineum]
MLTKPQVFYDNNLKQVIGFQNPFYLKKAQQIRPMLYDGNVIAKETNVISIADSEETLMLEEEKLSDEQALHPITDQYASSPVKIKAPRELPKDLRKFLKEKDIVDNAAQVSNATTIAPGMYKLGTIILAPKLIQELLGHVRDTFPDIHKPSEKLVAVTPINKMKKVRFADTVTSSGNIPKATNRPILSSTGVNPSTSASGSKSLGNTKKGKSHRIPTKVKSSLNKWNYDSKNDCNAHVKHPVKGAQALCSVCNECLFDANHAMCLIDHVNSMNVRAKSASKKNKKRKEWKPTRKVFNSVGYKWKPTERTFTLVGNACSLTRLTTTNKVPLRVPIPREVVAPKQVVIRVYTRRPKVPKSVQISKPKVAKSMTANKMEPGTSRGSVTLVAPSSSSLIDCRLSKLFYGIWTLDAPST